MFAIDGIWYSACTIWNIAKMGDAAKAATSLYCKKS